MLSIFLAQYIKLITRRSFPYASPEPAGLWQKLFNLTLVQTNTTQHLLHINFINPPKEKKRRGREEPYRTCVKFLGHGDYSLQYKER
jgi:hypothetical protein